MRIQILISVFILLSNFSYAQSSFGSIEGKVIDAETKEPLLFATIAISKTGQKTPVKKIETDLDGHYSFSNLDTGIYDLHFSYAGYAPLQLTEITISLSETVRKDIELKSSIVHEFIVVDYVEPPSIKHCCTTSDEKNTSNDTINQIEKNFTSKRIQQDKDKGLLKTKSIKIKSTCDFKPLFKNQVEQVEFWTQK